jgi:hypothetical protein
MSSFSVCPAVEELLWRFFFIFMAIIGTGLAVATLMSSLPFIGKDPIAMLMLAIVAGFAFSLRQLYKFIYRA